MKVRRNLLRRTEVLNNWILFAVHVSQAIDPLRQYGGSDRVHAITADRRHLRGAAHVDAPPDARAFVLARRYIILWLYICDWFDR